MGICLGSIFDSKRVFNISAPKYAKAAQILFYMELLFTFSFIALVGGWVNVLIVVNDGARGKPFYS